MWVRERRELDTWLTSLCEEEGVTGATIGCSEWATEATKTQCITPHECRALEVCQNQKTILADPPRSEWLPARLRMWPRSEFLFLPGDPARLSSKFSHGTILPLSAWEGNSWFLLETRVLWMPGPLSWLLAQRRTIHRPGRKPSHMWAMMQQPSSPPGCVAALTVQDPVVFWWPPRRNHQDPNDKNTRVSKS